MKKLLFTLICVGFVSLVQAGEQKSNKTADCCASSKDGKVAAACNMKEAKCSANKQVKKDSSTRQALLSPKDAAETRRL